MAKVEQMKIVSLHKPNQIDDSVWFQANGKILLFANSTMKVNRND